MHSKTKTYMALALAMAASAVLAQANKTAKKPQTAIKPATTMTARQKALYDEMLPNTQIMVVVDSTVVDIDKMLESIPLPADNGQMVPYNEFFATDTQPDAYVFVNGFGNKCFYSEMQADSTFMLYSRDKLNGNWSEPQPLQELGSRYKEINYPCMMSDGTTMYFSAVASDGLGGRDLYVTSYDQEEGQFMQPENVGLPYNSHADDLLYMEDDTDSLAWLATTRRQPKGKVCIYTIALTGPRENYDADDMDDTELQSLAAIECIEDTWTSEDARQEALARVEKVRKMAERHKAKQVQPFYVDDRTTCYKASDFSTAETRRLYESIVQKKQQRQEAETVVEQLRAKYRKATAAERSRMQQEILADERALLQLDDAISQDTKTLKNKEIAARKR